jgi:sRNA-binding protein
MLGWFTVRRAYLAAVSRGGPRYDLQGVPAGEVTAKDAAYSLKVFHERNARAIDPWPNIDTLGDDVHLSQAAE